jgi:hypothetical protein
MNHIKLFEEWCTSEMSNDIVLLNEAFPEKLFSDIALFSGDMKDIQAKLQSELGSENKVEVKETDVEEIKDPNLSKEIKDSLGNDVKSVMLIDVKKENNSTPHTFVIPKQKEKTKVNTTGVINLPTLYIGDKNTIEANIGGLRAALNSMAKGNDFDIDRFSAKVTVKHKF